MNVVSFLILWSLPFLHAGGHGQSLHPADAHAHASPVFLQPAKELSSPGDPGMRSPGASLEDEEDSLEDDVLDAGLLSSPSWRDLGRVDRSALARSRHDLFRSPSRSHPLRC
jgi:hypothetical protein